MTKIEAIRVLVAFAKNSIDKIHEGEYKTEVCLAIGKLEEPYNFLRYTKDNKK